MKKIMAFLLVFILCTALVSCGTVPSETPENETTAPADETTKAPQSEETTKAPEVPVLSPEDQKYESANEFIKNKEYAKAYALLLEIKDHKDASEILKKFKWGCTSQKHYSTLGNSTNYTYSYDETGNLIKETYEDSNGFSNSYTYTYGFDSQGRVTRKICALASGGTYTYSYSYDEKGNMIKEFADFGGSYTQTIIYEYDETGKITKETTPETDTVLVYSYDEKGGVSSKVGSGISTTFENEYDENGTLVRTTRKDGNYPIVYEYKYDEYGNLTEEKRIENFEGYFCATTEYSGYTCFYVG